MVNDTWYVQKNGKTYGPVSTQKLSALALANKLSKTDRVRANRESEWLLASEVPHLVFDVERLTSPVAKPVMLSEKAEDVTTPPTAPPIAKLELGNEEKFGIWSIVGGVWNVVHLFVSRILLSDFGRIKALPIERRKLAASAEPIEEPIAQDYASWRRSVLTVSLILTAMHLAFSVPDFFSRFTVSFNSSHKLLLVSFNFVALGLQIIGLLLLAYAAVGWADLRKSRRMVRFSWVVSFFGPILVFAIKAPVVRLVAESKVELALFAGDNFLTALIILGPQSVSLLPGVIRACLTLKTLLPEASAPGWATILVAPIYSLVFVILLCASAQLSTSYSLWGALVLFAASPLVYVYRSNELTGSHNETVGRRIVRSSRRISGLFFFGGLGLFVLQILRWFELGDLSLPGVINICFAFLGTGLLSTVAATDFIPALLKRAFDQNHSFHGSSLQATLEQKFASLTSVGLTDLNAGEGEIARRIHFSLSTVAQKSFDWATAKEGSQNNKEKSQQRQ